MLKNKLRTIIKLTLTMIVIVCIGVLFIKVNRNITFAFRNTAVNNMKTNLKAKTQIIELYSDSSASILKAFSRARELRNLLKDTNNARLKEDVNAYTKEYFADLKNWEGIYLSDWNSNIIMHSNKKAVGIKMRSGLSLKTLQNSILGAKGGVYHAGIVESPASGKLVLSMYCPIYDNDGKTVLGFVGGATLASNLKTVLAGLMTNEFKDMKDTMINVNTGTYIYDDNKSLISKAIKDPVLLSIIDNVKKNSNTNIHTLEYKGTDGKKHIEVYKYIPKFGWVLVLSDRSSEIYAQANRSRIVLGLICLISVILISAIYWAINLMKGLKKESTHDYITGLKNTRWFDEKYNKILKETMEDDKNIALFMIDIDHFKDVNDTYGHASGDEVMKQFGALLKKECGKKFLVARIGGEEFAVILNNIELTDVKNAAEHLRNTVASYQFVIPSGKKIHITISIGVAQFPNTVDDINCLKEAADSKLYEAKRTGRNKACI